MGFKVNQTPYCVIGSVHGYSVGVGKQLLRSRMVIRAYFVGGGGGIGQILEHDLGLLFFHIHFRYDLMRRVSHISFVFAFIFCTCRCVNGMFSFNF